MKIHIRQMGTSKLFYWTLITKNGVAICDSRYYKSKGAATKSARRLINTSLYDTSIKDKTGNRYERV